MSPPVNSVASNVGLVKGRRIVITESSPKRATSMFCETSYNGARGSSSLRSSSWKHQALKKFLHTRSCIPLQVQPVKDFEKMRESLCQDHMKPKPFYRVISTTSKANTKCDAASQTSSGFSPSMVHEAGLPEIMMHEEASPTKSHSSKLLRPMAINFDQI